MTDDTLLSRTQGLDPAYGCYTWPSAVVLAHWCLRSRFRVTGRSVLELGAGIGPLPASSPPSHRAPVMMRLLCSRPHQPCAAGKQ